uniref:NADH-ubiquinone oxidoreductase chain 3 n=1 Tax=Carychium tridentatum TaxID=145635 RepID=A0A1S5R346_9EUPU|nr:NADH dehydrogenase subunit 3 [Carychium tridentatum]ANC96341.1 NADH dehydrogenase subunit 3 [Carychium tridentatum]WIV81378.1 NADH dehydrogenase subunit 3 [Carychium tridentatum]
MFLYLLMFSTLLSLLLIMVFYFSSYLKFDYMGEKMTPFECGFEPLSQMRSPFSTRFFILVVLFLVFDVEVALLFPLFSMINIENKMMITWVMMFFMLVLVFGLFHEWREGAIDWLSSF